MKVINTHGYNIDSDPHNADWLKKETPAMTSLSMPAGYEGNRRMDVREFPDTPVRPGTVRVVASAEQWSDVWSELAWQDDEQPDGEPGRLLQILVDNTPEGVEDLEQHQGEGYAVWLTQAEIDEIERVTGIKLGGER